MCMLLLQLAQENSRTDRGAHVRVRVCAYACACAGEVPSNADLRPLICFSSLQRKFKSSGEEHVPTPLGRSGSEPKQRVEGDALSRLSRGYLVKRDLREGNNSGGLFSISFLCGPCGRS